MLSSTTPRAVRGAGVLDSRLGVFVHAGCRGTLRKARAWCTAGGVGGRRRRLDWALPPLQLGLGSRGDNDDRDDERRLASRNLRNRKLPRAGSGHLVWVSCRAVQCFESIATLH